MSSNAALAVDRGPGDVVTIRLGALVMRGSHSGRWVEVQGVRFEAPPHLREPRPTIDGWHTDELGRVLRRGTVNWHEAA